MASAVCQGDKVFSQLYENCLPKVSPTPHCQIPPLVGANRALTGPVSIWSTHTIGNPGCCEISTVICLLFWLVSWTHFVILLRLVFTPIAGVFNVFQVKDPKLMERWSRDPLLIYIV